MRTSEPPTSSRRSATVLGLAGVLVGLAGIGWVWAQSLVPGTYSVMTMGIPDFGGGPGAADPAVTGHAGHSGHATTATEAGRPGGVGAGPPSTSVTDLVARTGSPDVRVTVVARQQRVTLADGRSVDGYTLNGTTPGPTIEARQGDLVQVTLVNESVPDGVTLHWHGVDVPNAEDGVAGVTQDAVGTGRRHVYRFVAQDAGTYWYHSHNVSHRQVTGGLFGVLLIHPDRDDAVRGAPADVVAAAHTYDNVLTVAGRSGTSRIAATSGDQIRLRVVNTDSSPLRVAPGSVPFRVVAVDGRDLSGPGIVRDRYLVVPAGGRADLRFGIPDDDSAVRVQFGAAGQAALVIGPDGAPDPPAPAAADALDLMTYGTPAPLGFDPGAADRRFRYEIDRRPGFVDGRPGLYWTVNGGMFPDVPMFMVAEGDVVVMTITNDSGEVHPMHLHGHHAVVLSRNGVPATGSPWWVDSLDVGDGEQYDIAFVADNPGVWMDHCHNLPHATEGLVAHLMYVGVTTPFMVGGTAANQPE